MANQTDRSGVIFPPPLLMLLALGVALALQRFWPLSIGMRTWAMTLGAALSVFGIVMVAWGRMILVRGGTNVNPYKPSTAIVGGGPYRFTRNPLYVGMLSLFLGLSLLFGTWWGFILLLPAFLVLHYGVVRREERYLEGKFGQAYLSYKSTVRRWL